MTLIKSQEVRVRDIVVTGLFPGTLLWYDSSQPAHPRLHQTHVSPLLETGSMPRSLRPLIHTLRAIKSSAEVALMQEAGHISAQVSFYVTVCPCV